MHSRDDAAGGRRGLRAVPSPRLFEALKDRYGIEGADHCDLGGSSSLNLLLAGNAGRCVVRVYRPYVTPARLEDVQRVRRHLAGNGVPCSELITTRDGRPWIAFEDRLVEVERYVERDATMDSWERVRTGLPVLGRIHTLLRGITVGVEGKTPVFANYVAPRDALARTLRGTRRIRAWGPSSDEMQLVHAAEELAHRLDAVEQEFIPLVPRQLTHGDYWDNNVFFCNGAVAFVGDFDFLGERARIDDLALTLYYAHVTFSDDDAPQRLRDLVDAYERGLGDPLSRAERAALPLAIARQPLWSIGGWVALLDDEVCARQHAAGMYEETERSLRIVREIERWQAAFA
jgi:homoserine kinase type II